MTEHTGDAPSPESRSRELAAKATPGPWEFVSFTDLEDVDVIATPHGALLAAVSHFAYPHERAGMRGPFSDEQIEANGRLIAFHDPSLITAYVDVVEAAREVAAGEKWGSAIGPAPLDAYARLDAAIRRLDALAKDRG